MLTDSQLDHDEAKSYLFEQDVILSKDLRIGTKCVHEHLEQCMRDAPNLNGSTAKTQ